MSGYKWKKACILNDENSKSEDHFNNKNEIKHIFETKDKERAKL